MLLSHDIKQLILLQKFLQEQDRCAIGNLIINDAIKALDKVIYIHAK